MDDTHVTFRYKDRGADVWRTMRLPGVEFLRRFLQPRAAAWFSQSPLLRTVAPLEARLVKPRVAALDTPEADRHGRPAEDR